MVDASSFALFELDAKQCRIGLWTPESAGEPGRVGELASVAPVLALGADGAWLHGEAALARRIVSPQSCVLDLLEPEQSQLWQARASTWPFAVPIDHPEHGVCWSLQERLYPRAYLLSRLLVFARELAEAHAQGELRSMALVAGRSITPSLRQDLEQAAQLAGVSRLWWIDKMHALARSIRQQRTQKAESPAPSAALDAAQDEQDALSQINEVLVGGHPSKGPSTATLSHAEFAPVAATPAEQQNPDPGEPEPEPEQDAMAEGEGVEALDAEAELVQEADAAEQGVQASDTAQAESDETSRADESNEQSPPLGEWLWIADRMGLELAQLSIEPEIELHSRDLVIGVSQMAWQAKVVAQLHADLEEEASLGLDERPLAQVRIWDACGKMMERLEADAQTELHLAHLCVRNDQSFHYQGAWHRRRMDALIADAVAQLKERCQQEEQGEHAWQWGRYGSACDMPAFVRVAQQCSKLTRKDAKLPADSALQGAGIWIQERQGGNARSVAPDIMLGDLLWEHPSGASLRCSVHGQALPLCEDVDLQGAQLDAEEHSPWCVYLCLPGAQEEQVHRYCVARVLVPDFQKDARVRIEVQRNGKIQVSRSPSAKNAGAQDLQPLGLGLGEEQIADLELAQAKRDVDRFMGMRSQAMRKALAKHCAQLDTVLSERGDKMDDLLRTRLGEWVSRAKTLLTPELDEQSNKASLASLTPLHESFQEMVETFSPQQKKSLSIEQEPLPELFVPEQELGMPGASKPWWKLEPSQPECSTEPQPTPQSA